MDIDNVGKIAELFNRRYKLPEDTKHLLVEKNYTDTHEEFESCAELILYNQDVEYLTCRFEDQDGDNNMPELFPYFGQVKNLCKNCDYIIFACVDGIFYILLVELKLFNPSNKPKEQLRISKTFVEFLIKRFAAIGYEFIEEPKVRLIGIRDTQRHRIPKKQYTKPRDYIYDQDGYFELRDGVKGRHIMVRLDSLLK